MCDLVVDRGSRLILVEAKSGSTVAPRFVSGMRTLGDALEKSELTVERRLVYGGDLRHQRGGTEIVPWDRMLEIAWD